MSKRDSFLFYRDWAEALKSYPIELKSELFDAIVDFALDGTEEENISDVAKLILATIKPKLIRDAAKYAATVASRQESGRLGGIAKASKSKQDVANVANGSECQQMVDELANASDGSKCQVCLPNVANVANVANLANLADNVNDNVIKKNKFNRLNLQKKEQEAIKRRQQFYDSLIPFVDKYGAAMIRDFYDYWSEFNKSRTMMRFEREKTWELPRRVEYWSRRSHNNGNNHTEAQTDDIENPLDRASVYRAKIS